MRWECLRSDGNHAGGEPGKELAKERYSRWSNGEQGPSLLFGTQPGGDEFREAAALHTVGPWRLRRKLCSFYIGSLVNVFNKGMTS